MVTLDSLLQPSQTWAQQALSRIAIRWDDALGLLSNPGHARPDREALPGLTPHVETNGSLKEIVTGSNSLTVSHLLPKNSASNRLTFSLVAV